MPLGSIALLGSGETAPSSGVIYDRLARGRVTPLPIAVVETPAGFQPNSAQVAGKVADYLQTRLQNQRPQITLVPARARGTEYSPDADAATAGLLQAELIFLGPGSPTYAARQLQGSLALQRLTARQRHGAALITASAATVALGAYALPVYEIYKVGADLHWQTGLDYFAPYGLKLVLVPHWNNQEGGAELDTTHCFVGAERFARLQQLLPADVTIVGIDEHTGLVIDPDHGQATVMGRGSVTVLRAGEMRCFARSAVFALQELGDFRLPALDEGLPADVVRETAMRAAEAAVTPDIPAAVHALVEQRQAARTARDWAASDRLRQELAALGWQVQDTPQGAQISRLA
jgi:hypothetical protein